MLVTTLWENATRIESLPLDRGNFQAVMYLRVYVREQKLTL